MKFPVSKLFNLIFSPFLLIVKPTKKIFFSVLPSDISKIQLNSHCVREKEHLTGFLNQSLCFCIHTDRMLQVEPTLTDPCTSTMTPENSLLLKRKGCLPGSTFRDVPLQTCPVLGWFWRLSVHSLPPFFPWRCITLLSIAPGFTGAFPSEFSPFPLLSSLIFALMLVFPSHSVGILHSHSLSLCMCNMTNQIWPKLLNCSSWYFINTGQALKLRLFWMSGLGCHLYSLASAVYLIEANSISSEWHFWISCDEASRNRKINSVHM